MRQFMPNKHDLHKNVYENLPRHCDVCGADE